MLGVILLFFFQFTKRYTFKPARLHLQTSSISLHFSANRPKWNKCNLNSGSLVKPASEPVLLIYSHWICHVCWRKDCFLGFDMLHGKKYFTAKHSSLKNKVKTWCGRRDLNPGSLAWKAKVLNQTRRRPHMFC